MKSTTHEKRQHKNALSEGGNFHQVDTVLLRVTMSFNLENEKHFQFPSSVTLNVSYQEKSLSTQPYS